MGRVGWDSRGRGGRVTSSVTAPAPAPDNCSVYNADIARVEFSTVCLANDTLQLLNASKQSI